MAFTPNDLNLLVPSLGGGAVTIFAYATSDSYSTVLGTGYFTEASKFRLRVGDMILVTSPDNVAIVEVASITGAGHATGVETAGVTGDINPWRDTALVANGTPGVKTAFVSNGITAFTNNTEVQGAFGLYSNKGAGAGINQNKVALYAGITSDAGTGYTWSFNTVNYLPSTLGVTAGFFQGYECDIQNDSQDFPAAVSAPGSVGIQITAATNAVLNGGVAYKNQAGLWVTGQNDSWHYGIALNADAFAAASIWDYGNGVRSMLVQGTKTWGIDFIGTVTHAIRGTNNMSLIGAVNAAGSATLQLLKLDTSNRVVLGGGTTAARFVEGSANHFAMDGAAAAGSPVFSVVGSDVNIAAVYNAKGAAASLFGNGFGFQLEVSHPGATTVNRPYVRGSAAGLGSVLGTVGSDTNIDLFLLPKGTG
ncbi:MAG: hypothetical protein H0U59_01080, partial [Gemmatimonadaceae bacterium]|nr:hypothetical protein [Gemmatimonadaceae bacterium]